MGSWRQGCRLTLAIHHIVTCRGVGEMVPFLKLRPMSCVAFPVTDTKILSHKGAVTTGEVTSIDLFGGVLFDVSSPGPRSLCTDG